MWDEQEDDGCVSNDYEDDDKELMMEMVVELRKSRGLMILMGRGL